MRAGTGPARRAALLLALALALPGGTAAVRAESGGQAQSATAGLTAGEEARLIDLAREALASNQPGALLGATQLLELAIERGSLAALVELGRLQRDGTRESDPDPAAAAELFRRAADAGSVEGMVELARLHRDGLGVPADGRTALSLLERAAAGGDAWATGELGLLLLNGGPGLAPDRTRALPLLESAAAGGDLAAQVTLGRLYREGDGVPADGPRSAALLEAAAAGGNPWALRELAITYRQGAPGLPPDPALATRVLLEGEASGDAPLLIELARHYRDGIGVAADGRRAEALLQRAAPAGDAAVRAWAESELGILYLQGAPGLEPDPARAVALLTRAAGAGDLSAMVHLARLHAEGRWVTADGRQAERLLQAARARGSIWATSELGLLYLTGAAGLPADPPAALELLKEAAAAGDLSAMIHLGRAYRDGEIVAADGLRAKRLLSEAAARGSTWAMAELAVLYLVGAPGVAPDPAQAAPLLERAAAAGEEPAAILLGTLYRDGRGVAADGLRAEALLLPPAEGGSGWALRELGELYRLGAPGLAADPARALAAFESAIAAGNGYAALDRARLAASLGELPAAELLRLYLAAADSGLDGSLAEGLNHYALAGQPYDPALLAEALARLLALPAEQRAAVASTLTLPAAVLLFQLLYNETGQGPLAIDGMLGPATLAAFRDTCRAAQGAPCDRFGLELVVGRLAGAGS